MGLCLYLFLFHQGKGNALTRKGYEGQYYNRWIFFLIGNKLSRCMSLIAEGPDHRLRLSISTSALRKTSENRVLIWQNLSIFPLESPEFQTVCREGGDEILQLTVVFHGTQDVWVWSKLKPWNWMSRSGESVPILDSLLLGKMLLTLWRMSRELITTSSNTLPLLFGAHGFFKELKVIHCLHVFGMKLGVKCIH